MNAPERKPAAHEDDPSETRDDERLELARDAPPSPPRRGSRDDDDIEPPSLDEGDDVGLAAGLATLPRDLAVLAVGATAAGTRLLFGSLKATALFLLWPKYRRDVAFPFIRAVLLLNWSRVLLEIIRTRDMLVLLEKYAVGEKLSRKERAAVRAQLTDIARSVPALGIFALPGGALLLPILAKLLPFDIAPSAFSMKQKELDDLLRAKAATILGDAPEGTFQEWEQTTFHDGGGDAENTEDNAAPPQPPEPSPSDAPPPGNPPESPLA